MKAHILRIAGVNDEASFYKKFPTENAFMKKHGKEFTKAQNGVQTDSNSNGIPDYLEMQQMGPQNNPYQETYDNSDSDYVMMDDNQVQNPQSGYAFPGGPNTRSQKDSNQSESMGKGIPVFGKVLEGFQNLKKEKEARIEAEQWADVSEVVRRAAISNSNVEKPKRKYNTPWDSHNIVQPNQMYPSYGVNTNVLTAEKGAKLDYMPLKEGGKIPAYQMGGMSGGGGGMMGSMMGESGGGGFMDSFGQGSGADSIVSGAFGNNAGSQIGGGIGSIFGPVGSVIGTAVGGYLDKEPGKMRNAQNKFNENINGASGVAGIMFGNSVHNRLGAMGVAEDGASMGYSPITELSTHWGGHAKPLSRNRYLPDNGETVMFHGQSHDESDGKGNSGIGVSFGSNAIEVEGGEPAVKLRNGGESNLTVFGNLSISKDYAPILGDEKAAGKKFKNYIADLSKVENKQNRLVDTSMEAIDSLDVKTPFDKLKFSSLQANVIGGNMKLKDAAEKKMNAAELQNAINETAEEHNLDATALAKGKVKKNKDSDNTAQKGAQVKGQDERLDYYNAGETGNPIFDTDYDAWIEKVNKAYSDPEVSKKILNYFETNDSVPQKEKVRAYLKGKTNEEKIAFLKEQSTNRQVGPIHHLSNAAIDTFSSRPAPATATTPAAEPAAEDKVFEVPKYKRNTLADFANTILPFIRPTDQEGLDPNQLTGEMYALSTNALAPVQAQLYHPDLGTPYDISLQDQLNANQADFRAVERTVGNNPAALSSLAAQKYDANSRVLGEQFRMNQGMKDRVYSENRNTLNDAQLKNLSILDNQYTRQAQAASNTKATTQAALSSISDKYSKNKLENRTLGVYENLYNYRYDASGRAVNMNPLFQPNMPYVYNKAGQPTHKIIYDDNKNIVGYEPINRQAASSSTTATVPSLATPPIISQQEEEYLYPIEQNDLINKYSKGGNIKKGYSQSEILRSLK